MPLTKEQAIHAMKQGKKVAHRFFSHGEWITIDANDRIVTEDGYDVPQETFWADRRGQVWDYDWEIV